MNRILLYFTSPFSSDGLYEQEQVKTLVIASLVTIPSMALSLALHMLDSKPFPVIFADLLFFSAGLAALYLVKKKRVSAAGNIFIFSVLILIIAHNLVTDYLYEEDLSYYRLLETAIMFTLVSLSAALILQKQRTLMMIAIIGELCILTHYLIVVNKTGIDPMASRPFTMLVGYMLVYFTIFITLRRLLRTYENLLATADKESKKVKVYNQELEKRVQERTRKLEQQNQELKKVNSELDRFVYSASHDLRAPLTSVLGLINLAYLEEDPQQIRQYLELQEKSIRKLDAFIQDIVDISKNTRTEVRRDTVFFQKLVHEIFDQYSFMDNSKLISKHINIEQQRPFCTDKPRISIVLNNLLSNAIRYATPLHKEACIKVSGKVDEQMAVLEIEDNGRGIASEHIERIFEMFFRTDNDTQGSGLGLYIVRETLDKLGGHISVSSTLGKGTIFTVKIPSEVPCHSLSTT